MDKLDTRYKYTLDTLVYNMQGIQIHWIQYNRDMGALDTRYKGYKYIGYKIQGIQIHTIQYKQKYRYKGLKILGIQIHWIQDTKGIYRYM